MEGAGGSATRKREKESEITTTTTAATTTKRYKGIRMKGGKWVAETREPNNRSRIWLGSFSTPVAAARAYDAAVFYLRGPSARLNFPELLDGEGPAAATSDMSAASIRKKAFEVGARVDALHRHHAGEFTEREKESETTTTTTTTTTATTTTAATTTKRYRGIRMRKWGKWDAETREPKNHSRIWLGSYSTPVAAARAYDAAVFYLWGPSARLNFPELLDGEGPAAATSDMSAASIRKKAIEVGARVDALHRRDAGEFTERVDHNKISEP